MPQQQNSKKNQGRKVGRSQREAQNRANKLHHITAAYKYVWGELVQMSKGLRKSTYEALFGSD